MFTGKQTNRGTALAEAGSPMESGYGLSAIGYGKKMLTRGSSICGLVLAEVGSRQPEVASSGALS